MADARARPSKGRSQSMGRDLEMPSDGDVQEGREKRSDDLLMPAEIMASTRSGGRDRHIDPSTTARTSRLNSWHGLGADDVLALRRLRVALGRVPAAVLAPG